MQVTCTLVEDVGAWKHESKLNTEFVSTKSSYECIMQYTTFEHLDKRKLVYDGRIIVR
jgi:hypothetical protein